MAKTRKRKKRIAMRRIETGADGIRFSSVSTAFRVVPPSSLRSVDPQTASTINNE